MIDSPLDRYMTWRQKPAGDTWAVGTARRLITHLAVGLTLAVGAALHLVVGWWLGSAAAAGLLTGWTADHALHLRLYRRVSRARRNGGPP